MDAPKPPDKDSERYKNLRGALRRSAEKHFDAPQAVPPSVKEAQDADPSLAEATPPQVGGETPPEQPQETPPAGTPRWQRARPEKKKRKRIVENPVLRAVISIVLLGVIGYCGYYIYQFKLRGEDGQIWWPWETAPRDHTTPASASAPKAQSTVDNASTAASTETTAKLTAEDKEKLETEKRSQEEAARKATAEAQRKAAEEQQKKDAALALAQLEETELRSVSAVEASLVGYSAKFQYDLAAQQIKQLGAALSTEKAKARLAVVETGLQPLLAFKQTLIANVPQFTYNGRTLTNRQGSPMSGAPTKADAEKISFTSQYGTVATAWENLPPEQIAALATFYLKAKEKQASSKDLAQDYYNLMVYCLSQKLTSLAAQAGSEALTIDQSLRPKVKQLLGNLIP